LFKSTDGGISLQELPAEIGRRHNSIYDVAEDPYTGDLYIATSNGLFRSRDKGVTVQQIATDLSPDCPRCLNVSQILALAPRGHFMAVTSRGIVRTINEGVTWQVLSYGQGKIYPVDSTGRHLYLIDFNLMESTDGARNWENITTSIPGLVRYSRVDAMTDPASRPLYLSTDRGVYRLDP
jgi:hypothetical protein